jgi:hypothetical protein
VLDRLVDNKMYYKFIEFGNIEKEKEQIRKEEAEEEKRIDEELAREREEHLRNNPFLGNHLSSGDLRPQVNHNNYESHISFNEEEEEKGLFESDEEDPESPSKKKASSPSPKKHLRIAEDSDEETSPMKFSNFNSNSPAKSPSKNVGPNKMAMTMYGTTKHLEETKKKYQDVECVNIDFSKQYTKLVDFDG